MATEPTTPWRVERRYSNGCEGCPEIWAGTEWVAVVTGSLPHLLPAAHAKAERIVRAVNAFDSMFAALEKAQDAIAETMDEHDTACKCRQCEAYLAIQAAFAEIGDQP